MASPNGNETPLLEVSGVSYSFTKQQKARNALSELSFSVQPGERVAIVGGNGAGKSTLLQLIAGVREETEGHITRAADTALMQNIAIGSAPAASGLENLKLRGMFQGFTRQEVEERLPVVTEITQLGAKLGSQLQYFSAGMKTRVALASLFFSTPGILALDEAVLTLDEAYLSWFQEFLASSAMDKSCVLIAGHATEILGSFCTRMLRLKAGKIVYDGEFLTAEC